MNSNAKPASRIPLVVDLDGTLTFIQFASHRPKQAFLALVMLGRGHATFRAAVADHVVPDPQTIPIDPGVLAAVREAREAGRKVYLATAADWRFAKAIAEIYRKV
jgi:hydroxymethylpyrimidine pyrophosphatase-like HAD family hydrolase